MQKQLGLVRRPDNHIVFVSIRPHGTGRWNHHYFKLTHDNEFAVPSDVPHVRQGGRVDVRVHRIIPDVPAADSGTPVSGGAVLTKLAARARAGWRQDGSERLDDYLREAP